MRIGIFLFLPRRQVKFGKSEIDMAAKHPAPRWLGRPLITVVAGSSPAESADAFGDSPHRVLGIAPESIAKSGMMRPAVKPVAAAVTPALICAVTWAVE
jgi:hypothetical protein